MLKEDLMACIDQAYDYGKKLIAMWSDHSMQHIRLQTANLRKIEQSRQHHIEEMDQRKLRRFKDQAESNYQRWKNSDRYDPKKDIRLQQ